MGRVRSKAVRPVGFRGAGNKAGDERVESGNWGAGNARHWRVERMGAEDPDAWNHRLVLACLTNLFLFLGEGPQG